MELNNNKRLSDQICLFSWHTPCIIIVRMRNLKMIALSLSLAVLAACGSASQNTASSTANGSTASSSVPGCVGNCNNWPSAVQQQVILGGNNSPNLSKTLNTDGGNPAQLLETNLTLKVKVSALPAGYMVNPLYSNFSVAYGCVEFTVVVNGATQYTGLLSVAGTQSAICPNASNSVVLDFSSTMTGYGPVNVTIGYAQFDNCRLSNTATYGCSMSPVWQNDIVPANVTIQTDRTYME